MDLRQVSVGVTRLLPRLNIERGSEMAVDCAARHWSSRGYQNIMRDTAITMSRGVVKDIKWQIWRGSTAATYCRRTLRKRIGDVEGRGRKINSLLYVASRMWLLSAPDSQPKGPEHKLNTSLQSNTGNTSTLSPFVSFSPHVSNVMPLPLHIQHSHLVRRLLLGLWRCQRSDPSRAQDKSLVKTVITPVSCWMSDRRWD